MAKKQRIDIILVNKGFAKTREKAKHEIMAGNVWIGTNRIDKPGTMVDPDLEIVLKGETNPYVSRGGLKLEKALKEFNVNVTEKTAIDVGASTGGFTDCLLKNGAFKIYAIDVGYGQLDWGLRNDSRVIVMERTNARYLTREDFPELFDIATIDVSFISLKNIFPAVRQLIKNSGIIISLIKPQFEAGREQVRKGVVKDPVIHLEVLKKVKDYANKNGLYANDFTYSPIKGPEGNIEFFSLLSLGNEEQADLVKLEEIVLEAHRSLAIHPQFSGG